MGNLDNAAVTDRPAATTPSRDVAPRTPVDEPHDSWGGGRIASLAVGIAAATTAALVVLTSGGDEPVGTARATDVVRTPAATATADPALPAPANPTDPAATAGTQPPGATSTAGAPGAAPGETSDLPAGWEARIFEGITFAVPPGATGPDVVDPGTADAPALFSWNGPNLGGEIYSHVSMWIYSADAAPTLGPEYRPLTVAGADRAHMWTGPTGADQSSITVDVHIVAGSRYVNLNAAVAPGAAGEQTVRDLVASVVVG